MNIRLADASDARAIAEVHVHTWQAAYRGIVPQDYLDAMSVDKREIIWRESIARKAPELWVAQSQSAITGWVAFDRSRDADARPAVGEVQAIYVAPDHWSTGTGRELWQLARARLLERGFTSVTLWVLEENERATRFYRAAGFTANLATRKNLVIGGKALAELRYERVLG